MGRHASDPDRWIFGAVMFAIGVAVGIGVMLAAILLVLKMEV